MRNNLSSDDPFERIRTHLTRINEQRYARCLKFLQIFGDLEERRVRNGSSVDDAIEGEVEDVTSAEAVACGSEACYPFFFKRSYDFVKRRPRLSRTVLGEPGGKIELGEDLSLH